MYHYSDLNQHKFLNNREARGSKERGRKDRGIKTASLWAADANKAITLIFVSC